MQLKKPLRFSSGGAENQAKKLAERKCYKEGEKSTHGWSKACQRRLVSKKTRADRKIRRDHRNKKDGKRRGQNLSNKGRGGTALSAKGSQGGVG